jgi:predicted solute-binding protein
MDETKVEKHVLKEHSHQEEAHVQRKKGLLYIGDPALAFGAIHDVDDRPLNHL